MQALMVKELFGLARRVDESLSMPLFRTQQWYFFFVATFYLYGRYDLLLLPRHVQPAAWHA